MRSSRRQAGSARAGPRPGRRPGTSPGRRRRPGPDGHPGQPQQREDQQRDQPLMHQRGLERRDHRRVADIDSGVHPGHGKSFLAWPGAACGGGSECWPAGPPGAAGRAGGPEPAQPDAAGHHERRRGRHRRPGDQRVEEPGGGERDRGDVVAERPGQIAPDGRQRGPGQPDRVGDHAEVIPQQDQVRGADRHVGARPERHPQVGGGQRGPVVDPVPGHRHPAAAEPAAP